MATWRPIPLEPPMTTATFFPSLFMALYHCSLFCIAAKSS
jgi:hypothetical protein